MHMMDSQHRPAASLTSLPVECRQLILRLLPDISTLQTTILLHSSLYDAFLNQKDTIIKRILSQLISCDLFPEAIAVLKSSQIEPWTRERVLGILHYYFNREIPSDFECTIKNAVRIEGLHRVIEAFIAKFATNALSKNPLTGASENPADLPISDHERRRIISSFYRFELYTRLFRTRSPRREQRLKEVTDFVPKEQYNIFFRKFSPWELEQLISIEEYLYRELSRSFNDVAAHDLQWGMWRIPYADVEAWDDYQMNNFKKNFMFSGLEPLLEIIMAKDYEDRHRLLSPRLGQERRILSDLTGYLNSEDDGVELKHYDGEKLETTLATFFVKDPDLGPAQAWKWAHLKCTRACFVGNLLQRELRRRGYVMWDHSRLVRWGFFESPEWQDPGYPDEDETARRRKEMQHSWVERRGIYNRKFWGPFREKDESKLTRWRLEFSSDEDEDENED